MKRFFSSVCLFILCTVMSFSLFNVKEVNAAENTDIVYYQAVIGTKNSNKYAGLTAVKQKYYKAMDNLDNVPMVSSFNGISDDNICGEFNLADNICNTVNNKEIIRGSLAQLSIKSNGDLILDVGTDVKIGNLHIYYIIANKSNDAQLFCDNNLICPKAKKVNLENGNWKDMDKNSNSLNFTNENLTTSGIFSVMNLNSGAAKRYTANIFNSMHANYSKLAAKSGVYVVTSMTISYKDELYYVGNYNVKMREYSDIGNTSQSGASYAEYDFDASSEKESDSVAVSLVSSYAALVKNSSYGTGANSSYNEINEFFKTTLRPIIMIAIGILFIVRGVMLGVNIVKSSDEPDVRSTNIKHLVALFTAALAIYLILIFYEDLIAIVNRFIGE